MQDITEIENYVVAVGRAKFTLYFHRSLLYNIIYLLLKYLDYVGVLQTSFVVSIIINDKSIALWGRNGSSGSSIFL